jgi:hypothetical protein
VQRDARGFTTIQYVVATSFSLLLFVAMANFLVDLYQRGAVRDALDEGVRAAVPRSAGPAECEARARDVIQQVAGGSLLRIDLLQCAREGDLVVARAHVTLRSWVPFIVPSLHLDLRAAAEQES